MKQDYRFSSYLLAAPGETNVSAQKVKGAESMNSTPKA